MTNREFVDTVIGDLGVYRKDDHTRIPRRLVLYNGLAISQTYHAQRLGERTLLDEEKLLTRVPCVELEEVKRDQCGLEIYRCDTIMRSKCKIPESVYGRFGNSVRMVTNITDTKKLDKVTYESVLEKNSKGRYSQIIKSKPRWFIFGGYLYVLDWPIQVVNVWIFTLQRDDTCETINICDSGELICPCTDRWDVTFVASDRLIKFIIDETIARTSPSRTSTTDENPDNNSNSTN